MTQNKCVNCHHYEEERAGYEEGNYIERQECMKRPRISNLRSFPFKKEQACFVPDFWLSEFAKEVNASDSDVDYFNDACTEPMKKWREKYMQEFKMRTLLSESGGEK